MKRPARPPKPKPHPPTKHKYDCVVLRYWEQKLFGVHQLREAVELLSTAPDTKSTGLSAVACVKAGTYTVMAQPVIPYKDIVGKTPKQLWAMLDERVDKQVAEAMEKLTDPDAS